MLSCKIRRKKCDETKPACRRCISSGRVCDGYSSAKPTATRTKEDVIYIRNHHATQRLSKAVGVDNSGTARPGSVTRASCASKIYDPLHVWRTLSLVAPGQELSDLERHCFSFFQHQTTPQFAAYFESSIWRTKLLHGVFSHPVLFTAATALGAVHRRFTYGISREAFEYCAHAARLHRKAFQGLEELKNLTINRNILGTSSHGGHAGLSGVEDRDVMVACELLLGLFEAFQGEYYMSNMHMRNAFLYLFDTQVQCIHTESRDCAVQSKPRVFCRLFYQLHCKAIELFGTRTNVTLRLWAPSTMLAPIPTVFRDMEQARDCLFTEADWIMHEPVRAHHEKIERAKAQNRHVRRLMQWTSAYTTLIRETPQVPFQNEKHTLLKLTRDAIFMLLCMTFFVDIDHDIRLPEIPDLPNDISSEEASDPHLRLISDTLWHTVSNRGVLNVNYTHIKRLVEKLLDEHPLYSCENGTPGGELSVTSGDSVDEASQALAVYNLAETICAIEEYAAVEVIDTIRKSIAGNMELRWMDITGFVEQRKLLLRYYQTNEDDTTNWVQEWWTF